MILVDLRIFEIFKSTKTAFSIELEGALEILAVSEGDLVEILGVLLQSDPLTSLVAEVVLILHLRRPVDLVSDATATRAISLAVDEAVVGETDAAPIVANLAIIRGILLERLLFAGLARPVCC